MCVNVLYLVQIFTKNLPAASPRMSVIAIKSNLGSSSGIKVSLY